MLHPPPKLLAMTLDVLVNGALDELGLLEPRHQRGVADLLLRGFVNLDGRLSTGHSVPRYHQSSYVAESVTWSGSLEPVMRPHKTSRAAPANACVAPFGAIASGFGSA